MGGVSQPFPNIFDPLNFLGSAGSSNNPIRDVRRWRESELTHGRVCMLAALGFIVQEQLIDTNIRPFPFVKGTFSDAYFHHSRGRLQVPVLLTAQDAFRLPSRLHPVRCAYSL